jgi:alpha-glucosidase (family GH31 glycosyl hydrolase)
MNTLTWNKKASGIWSAIVGKDESLKPLSVVGANPVKDALDGMDDKPFPFDLDSVISEKVGGRTIACFPLDKTEKIFGLGLQFMRVNHRGRTRYLRVNSDPTIDIGESHAPVPFYVSSRGYGVLVNTSRIVTIYCGSCGRKTSPVKLLKDRNMDRDWQATPSSDLVEIVVPSNGFEVIVFAGNSVLDVVRRYNLYCGGGTLPPRWGLGFWHRVPTSFTDEQAIAEAEEFRKRQVPCDVIGLEPGWHTKSYPSTYEWSERFPNPAEFVSKMKSLGLQINLWEHPYVSPESKIHSELEPLSGSHTVWGGLVPDYSLKEAQDILKDQHEKDHINIGVSGYKIDECDGSELTGSSWMFPAHAIFPSGYDGEQIRQIYGLTLQKMIFDIFRKHNRRTYGLVRASLAGASPLPFALYSDLYDHHQFVRALCNSGFSGLLWSPEIRSAGNPEEWVRRLQVVCFSPLAMLNAWASGTKPWSFSDVEHIVQKYINLRMRLMPYFYSAFARYHFDGTPPFRGMAMEISNQEMDDLHFANLEKDDQYMAGDSMLIAPLFTGQTSREVFLPKGVWYDFETGERFDGGQIINISAGLEKLPIFVREGGIIPMMPVMPSAPKAGEAVPLEILHYGNKSSMFKLYDDDGETFDYEKGDYIWRTLEVKVSEDGIRHGTISKVDDSWVSSYGDVTWKFM